MGQSQTLRQRIFIITTKPRRWRWLLQSIEIEIDPTRRGLIHALEDGTGHRSI